jgi:hypothetical protein
MSLAIKGRITKILDIESGTSRAGKEWKKQAFVLDSGAQYNPEICFSVFGEDKIGMLSNYKAGQEVEVSFNVSSREYNGKYYHNIDAWKIEALGGAQASDQGAPPPMEEPMTLNTADFSADDDDDDLPF